MDQTAQLETTLHYTFKDKQLLGIYVTVLYIMPVYIG